MRLLSLIGRKIRRPLDRITTIHIKAIQEFALILYLLKGWIFFDAKFKKHWKFVDFSKFQLAGDNVCLEIFLRCLMEMKTDLREKPLPFLKIYPGKLKILFGFFNPFLNNTSVNHIGFCLLSGSLSRMDRPFQVS